MRRGTTRPTLRLDRLGDFLSDPGSYLFRCYQPTSLGDEASARSFIHRLAIQLRPLAQLAGAQLESASCNLPASWVPTPDILLGRSMDAAEIAAHQRMFRSLFFRWQAGDLSFGLSAEALIAGETGSSGLTGPGLELGLVGGYAASFEEEAWSLEASVTAEVDFLGIGAEKLYFGVGTPSLSPVIEGQWQGPISLCTAPLLEVGALRFGAFATLDAQHRDAGFSVALDGLRLGLGPSDGFLAEVLTILQSKRLQPLRGVARGG